MYVSPWSFVFLKIFSDSEINYDACKLVRISRVKKKKEEV
jgi:hypothetical protein